MVKKCTILAIVAMVLIVFFLSNRTIITFSICGDRIIEKAVRHGDPRELIFVLRKNHIPQSTREKAWVGLADFRNETGIDVFFPNEELKALCVSLPRHFQHGEAGFYAYPQVNHEINPYVISVITNEGFDIPARWGVFKFVVSRHEHNRQSCERMIALMEAFPPKAKLVCKEVLVEYGCPNYLQEH